jgi:hypothetical protein
MPARPAKRRTTAHTCEDACPGKRPSLRKGANETDAPPRRAEKPQGAQLQGLGA